MSVSSPSQQNIATTTTTNESIVSSVNNSSNFATASPAASALTATMTNSSMAADTGPMADDYDIAAEADGSGGASNSHHHSTSGEVPPVHYSVSHAEEPVLDSLITIRHRLTVLKRDRDNYYRPSDIISLYNDLLQQVAQLKRIRESEHHDDDAYKNRVDAVLDDCFQLFSLFYMAMGKNREIPATYVQLVTIKQNLDLLDDSGIYTRVFTAVYYTTDSNPPINIMAPFIDDLTPFEKRLSEILEIISHDKEQQLQQLQQDNECDGNAPATTTPRAEVLLVERRYRQCAKSLQRLLHSTAIIDAAIVPIYNRLVHVRRRLTFLRTQTPTPTEEIKQLQVELLDIDEQRVNDRFVDQDGEPYAGQAEVAGLLELCFEDIHEALVGNLSVPDEARPIYDRLIEIKTQLDKLLLTHRWTLRETDLWSYQVQLSDIDNMREHGEFRNSEGEPYPATSQATLNYLLHKCYSLLYKLLSSSEPVAESLMPVHNQLRTLRRCLMEVKKYGGPYTPRDLYPYQMKLSSIDNLRVDGKFLDEEGHTPEGQGVIMTILNQCYDILYELMTTECDD
ncbi:hypothetical protein H4219_004115 [Mycoemilia scoparia]|uniref:Uncharacterized protein n=1 Tax=Mycoemilia scoparia TaxID=417184 RepID=A0A9W8DRX4_9FUNG|nr:hypothetical protein H4219_004115 [Mycoemilia scoparia]